MTLVEYPQRPETPRGRSLGGAVFAALILAACSTTPAGAPMADVAAEINSTLTNSDYALWPGDVLEVRFPRLAEWDQQEVLIGVDGKAAFLGIDGVPVAGRTLRQVDALLTEAYADVLADPDLTVQLAQRAEQVVSVLGEVGQAGTYPLPETPLSLIEAFGLAAGFTRDTARLDQLLLVRWMPDENRVRSWKIDASVERWGDEPRILLQNRDVIMVPAKPVVYVNDWFDRYIRRNIPFPYLFRP